MTPDHATQPQQTPEPALWSYPRFLRRLAHDTGLGDLWDAYMRAISELHDRRVKYIAANLDPPLQLRQIQDKQRRRRLRKELKKRTAPSFESDPENRAAIRKVEAALADIAKRTDDEPLVHFLLPPADDRGIDSEVCRRIAPRMKEVAETWEAAPAGRVGWRERALELADAMQLAGQHPDIALYIDG